MTNPSDLASLVGNLAQIASDPDEVVGYEPASADFIEPRRHRVSIDSTQLQKLMLALKETPWLSPYEGGIAHYSPSSNCSISMESFAQWLVAQARGASPQDCISRLQTALEENSGPLLEIVPIWGISPKQEISLGEGLRIIPIEALPTSKLKDLFTGLKRHRFSFDVANSSPRPGAAVVKETVHGPIYERNDAPSAVQSRMHGELMLQTLMAKSAEERDHAMRTMAEMMDPLKAARESTSIYPDAEELVCVVALLTPKPIFPLGQWYQRPASLPIVGRLGGYSGPTNEHPFYIHIEKQDYPVQEIESLVASYLALPLATRKQLRTPLKRLNQGRRQLAHHTAESAAIDIGIAAEALLTQDRDHDAPISYLLRTRGTLLLGGNSEVRRRNYDGLRDVYNLRSKVAHQGDLVDRSQLIHSEDARKKLREATKALEFGQRLCAEMIQRIIADGKYPSWDNLTLGI